MPEVTHDDEIVAAHVKQRFRLFDMRRMNGEELAVVDRIHIPGILPDRPVMPDINLSAEVSQVRCTGPYPSLVEFLLLSSHRDHRLLDGFPKSSDEDIAFEDRIPHHQDFIIANRANRVEIHSNAADQLRTRKARQ